MDEKDTKPVLRAVTQAEFQDLEAKYRHLYIIDVTFDKDERYQFIAKRPTRQVIEAVAANKDNAFKIADMMIENMVVAGDRGALDDGVVFSRLLEKLTGIVKDGKALFTKA